MFHFYFFYFKGEGEESAQIQFPEIFWNTLLNNQLTRI